MRLLSWNLFIIIFLSANTLMGQDNLWRTVMYSNDSYQYFLGNEEPPSDWNARIFNDSNWLTGDGSIGYADNDDNTVIQKVRSLYMRHEFNVVDSDAISKIILHADYDDGFVAYINGEEIARSNLNGQPPLYNRSTPMYREAIVYTGGVPEVFRAADISNLLVDGKNVISIQTHNFEGLSSSDLTTLYWLSFGFEEPSLDYRPTPIWFEKTIFQTELPIISIDTDGETIEDEPEIPGILKIIYEGEGSMNSLYDEPIEYSGPITIEKRGQSSLDVFPKNGYGIETKNDSGVDIDTSFLGFPAEEDWILHGPYSDKTLMRNVLAMHLANQMGQYASRTKFVELFINDQYEGVYVLMEKIKRDDGRVDIAKLRTVDTSGDELSGGYIFKIDKGPVDFESKWDTYNNPGNKLKFQYVYPRREDILPEQKAYLQSYVDSFEIVMLNPGSTLGLKTYEEFADVPSFIDHFLISELTKEVDAYRISSYYHKDKNSNGGLLKAGPVWDFNLAFGNADYCKGDTDDDWIYENHCGKSNPFWWAKMLSDQDFANATNCRWKELRSGPFATDTINEFIDTKTDLLINPAERNFARWPILDEYIWPNPQFGGSFEDEVDYMKEFIEERLVWMDINMVGTCLTNTKTIFTDDVVLYPNPTRGLVSIKNIRQDDVTHVNIYDAQGNLIKSVFPSGPSIDISYLSNGLFVFEILVGKRVLHQKILKTN